LLGHAVNPDHFRDALREFGISQRRFAAIWGTTSVSVSRWLIGVYPFPGWVAPAIASMHASDWWRDAPDITGQSPYSSEAFHGHVRLHWWQGGDVTAYLAPDAPSKNPVSAALDHLRAIGVPGENLILVEDWSADENRYRVQYDRATVEAEEFE
jgi:hypothetical protein